MVVKPALPAERAERAPSPALALEAISHAYGHILAADRFDLTIEAGEFVCLLGPSGCGKSTVLRLAAGLEPLQQGRILMGGALMADAGTRFAVAPELRNIGLVFQDSALFPHLTVAQNVAFGLGGLSEAERRQRVLDMLAQVDMQDFAAAYPHALSGGQQQRIALARALAPLPKVMLLDEPFSGLDARLRSQIRTETLRLLKRSGIAALLVTHDPEEAMFMADRLYVMKAGRVIQSGSPYALYRHPVSAFVAEFLAPANRLRARVSGGRIATPCGTFPAPGHEDGTAVELLIRPETIRPLESGQGLKSGPGFRGRIRDLRFIGDAWLARVLCADGKGGEIPIDVRLPGDAQVEVQSVLEFAIAPETVLIFPQQDS